MAQRPFETIKTYDHFLTRKCGTQKAPQGWYKSELTTFCVKNNVPGFEHAKTVDELCKLIDSYFKKQGKLPLFGFEPPSDKKLKEMCKEKSLKVDPKWTRADLLKHCWEAREDVIAVEERHSFSIGKKTSYQGKLSDKVNNVAMHMSAMLYLLKTYKNIVCLPIKPEALLDPTFGRRHVCEFNLCWSFKTFANGEQAQNMEWTHGNNESNLWNIIENWCDKRFVLLPLYITAFILDDRMNHQNYVIIDRVKRTMERFEPNGSSILESLMSEAYGDTELNKVLTQTAKTHGYKYLKPSDFCPRIGPQEMERLQLDKAREGDLAGFCTFWSIWYADRRLRHPNIEPKILMDRLMNELQKSKIKMRNFIRDYAQFHDTERSRLLRLARAKQRTSGWSDERVITEVLLRELMGV